MGSRVTHSITKQSLHRTPFSAQIATPTHITSLPTPSDFFSLFTISPPTATIWHWLCWFFSHQRQTPPPYNYSTEWSPLHLQAYFANYSAAHEKRVPRHFTLFACLNTVWKGSFQPQPWDVWVVLGATPSKFKLTAITIYNYDSQSNAEWAWQIVIKFWVPETDQSEKYNNHVNVSNGGPPNNDSLRTTPSHHRMSCPQEPNKSDVNEIVFKIVMKQKVERTVFICNCAAQCQFRSPSRPPKHKWWPSAGLGAAHVLAYVSYAHRPGGPSTLVSPHGRYILRSVLRGNVSCLSPPFVRLLMYHLGVQFNFVTAINADYMHHHHRQRKVRPGRLLFNILAGEDWPWTKQRGQKKHWWWWPITKVTIILWAMKWSPPSSPDPSGYSLNSWWST